MMRVKRLVVFVIALATLSLLSSVSNMSAGGNLVTVQPRNAPPLTSPETPSRDTTEGSPDQGSSPSGESNDAEGNAEAQQPIGGGPLTSSSMFANGAANRSPHRPKKKLALVDGEANQQKAVSEVNCWDQNGKGRSVPQWLVTLAGSIEPNYDVIQRASVEDEWQILLDWVPEKFMAPQKAGRKADGSVLEAPTRGRDPQYYLNEYNASWHVETKDGGLRHHAQVVHRNAIAVCVRERIHLSEMFCSWGSHSAPLRIYSCICRKCRYGDAKSTKVSMEAKHPNFKRPSFHGVTWEQPTYSRKNFVPPEKTASAKCVELSAAPWLAPEDHVFEYEKHYNDLPALLRVQADSEKSVIVTIFNKFWVDHLHNFVYSMVTRARMQHFIVAVMDVDSLRLCQKNRMPCYNATALAELELDIMTSKGAAVGHKRKVTEEMSWIKPRLAVAILSRGYGFFMTDLDMTWANNPMQHINAPGSPDIAHQCDSPSKFSINSGFYYARSNPRTVQFFNNIMVFRPAENSDQTAMKLFSRYDHTHGATNACLDKWYFNMKCNYKVAGSVKMVGGVETFRWKKVDSDRQKFTWSIMHATCLSGAQPKLLWLRTINAWFLDDLEKKTADEYCLSLPDGSEVKSTARTVHSSKYSTESDSSFLQDRH